jgi:hypothetical protein
MTFSATLDRTIRIYRTNFRPLLAISALMGVLGLPFLTMMQNPDRQGGSGSQPWGMLGVLFVFGIVFTTFEYAVFGHIALAAVQGRKVAFGPACRAALARLFTLMGVSLLTVIAVGFGVLLLVVPGIYIGLGFSLAFMVVMAEGAAGPVAALRRSWRLAAGLRPRIFGALLVWALLNAVLSYAIGGVVQLLGVQAGPLLTSAENMLAGVLVAPCYGLSLALIYLQAREQKEGHDLALAAQRLPGAAEVPAG